MQPIHTFESTAVVLAVDDVDTDQIIPARFLKVTDRDGLGGALFADWRYAPDGTPRPDFVLNGPAAHEARVLVAGHNFGCGSSREHAAWALLGYGFRAVVSTDFADIFANNALKNGLLPVTLAPTAHARLREMCERDPAARLRIDLEQRTLTLPDGETVGFPIDEFARHCLLNGVDQLGFLLDAESEIAAHERTHPARVETVGAQSDAAGARAPRGPA